MNLPPVIIAGMARSGTTLAAHVLGLSGHAHVELEPHMMWKSGNFQYLADNEYELDQVPTEWIRGEMLGAAGEKLLVEKSPPNCLRPQLVHHVFPDARIVYVERDFARCVSSNISRSKKQDSLKLSIILKKYLHHSGSRKALAGAIGRRTLARQLRAQDRVPFLRYALRMFILKKLRGGIPFGPKLKGFEKADPSRGYLKYHVAVACEAEECKKLFLEYYGERMSVFALEALQRDEAELRRLRSFCGIPLQDGAAESILQTYDSQRVAAAGERADDETEILAAREAFLAANEG